MDLRGSIAGNYVQLVSALRPLRRRRLMIRRPLLVFMRARKPCFLCLMLVLRILTFMVNLSGEHSLRLGEAKDCWV